MSWRKLCIRDQRGWQQHRTEKLTYESSTHTQRQRKARANRIFISGGGRLDHSLNPFSQQWLFNYSLATVTRHRRPFKPRISPYVEVIRLIFQQQITVFVCFEVSFPATKPVISQEKHKRLENSCSMCGSWSWMLLFQTVANVSTLLDVGRSHS